MIPPPSLPCMQVLTTAPARLRTGATIPPPTLPPHDAALVDANSRLAK